MADAPQADSPPRGPKRRLSPLAVVALLVLFCTAMVLCVVTGATLGALLSFISPTAGFVVGVLFALVGALVLPLRAAWALRRRHKGVALQLVAAFLLLFATEVALIGAVLQFTSTTTHTIAARTWTMLVGFGGLPVLSDLLEEHAKAGGLLSGPKAPLVPSPGVGPDGGPVSFDGGPSARADGGVAAPTDAGPAGAPPYSARTATGRAIRGFAAAIKTDAGTDVLLAASLRFGGAIELRSVELSGLGAPGAPTALAAAEDGSAAAISAGAKLVLWPAGGKPRVDALLARGQKLDGKDIQGLRDVVVAPGGAALVVVEVAGDDGVLLPLLVALPQKGAPLIVRKAGDAVPRAAPGSVVGSFVLKRGFGDGTVCVQEIFEEGGDGVAVKLDGDTFTMDPSRLLAGRIDAPRALAEVARTGDEPSGGGGGSLQSFGGCGVLADGRAVFDANFLEKGREGWLFFGRPGGGVFAAAPELLPTDGAPWSKASPRLVALDVEPEGAFGWKTKDGGALLASITRPTETRSLLSRGDAFLPDGARAGTIVALDAAWPTRGAAFVVVEGVIESDDAKPRRAILLASRADLDAGHAEVVVQEGRPIAAKHHPAGAPPTVASVTASALDHELLWTVR